MRVPLLVVLCAARAMANVTWSADFENQNLSDFDGFVVHAERWTFVTMPTPAEGQRAARIELQANDLGPSNLVRTEVSHTPSSTNGFVDTEQFYGWSSMLSTDFPLGAFDHQLMFFECVAPIYQQEMSLHVNGTTVSFAVSPQGGNYQQLWTAPMSAGVWHRFQLHVRWSLDSSVGFVELWFDGMLVVQKHFMKTLHANGSTALVSAMHHALFLGSARANKPVEVVYLDDVRQGTTLADVAALVLVVDAGMPDAGEVDSGVVDSGVVDSGVVDAGMTDAGVVEVDAGVELDAGVVDEAPVEEVRGGCGAAPMALWFCAALLLRRRRLTGQY